MFERSLLASAAASVAMSSQLAFPSLSSGAAPDPTIAHNRPIKARVFPGACKLGPFSSIKKRMRHARRQRVGG